MDWLFSACISNVSKHWNYWAKTLKNWSDKYKKWVVLCGIKFGFPVHSTTNRLPTNTPKNVNPKLDLDGWTALNTKFEEWIDSSYIQEIANTSKAIFHPAYVIPKRNGGHRPILNLSWPPKTSVNDGIHKIFRTCVLPTFGEVTEFIYNLTTKGYCAAIDLKDAWKQFEICPPDRKCFGLIWENKRVVETRFPFGWAEAVRYFGLLLYYADLSLR